MLKPMEAQMKKLVSKLWILVVSILIISCGTLRAAEIVKEETNNYRAIISNLSSYSSEEIMKLPIVVRKEYKVVVPGGLSKADVKNVVKDIINEELKKDINIDEMIIFIYDDKRDADSFYTVGKAIWAVGGKLGNITPQIAKSNNKDKHSISFHIKTKGVSSNKPTDRELKIYHAYNKALWKDVSVSESVVASQMAKKFGITSKEADRIFNKVSIWKIRGK